MHPAYRNSSASVFAHPREVVRIMYPQIIRTRLTIAHHFARRHDGRGSRPARNWVAELRRIDAASGYSAAVRQTQREAAE